MKIAHNAKIAALAVAIAFAIAAPGASRAGGPLPYPPASEITQIANKVQLAMAYAKQVQQFALQVKQYEAQLKQLTKMSPDRLKQMLLGVGGVSVGQDVQAQLQVLQELNEALAGIQGGMDVLIGEGNIAQRTIDLMRKRGIEIDESNYLSMYAGLAKLRGGIYAERYRALQKAVDDVQNDVMRVDALAKAAPEIESNIQGFGALLQANAVMTNQLAGVKQIMAMQTQSADEAARALQAREARDRAGAQAALIYMDALSDPNIADPKQGRQ